MKALYFYTKQGCPYCSLLKAELTKRKIGFILMDVSDNAVRAEFYTNSGTSSVPQLFLSEEDECTLTTASGISFGGWSEVSLDWKVLAAVNG